MEVPVSIAVDPDELRSGSGQWIALSGEGARVRAALELAVAEAATSAGHPAVGDELGRFWSRWGSALAARVSDLDLLGQLLDASGGAYGSVETCLSRSIR
jgi:hypothetical protein